MWLARSQGVLEVAQNRQFHELVLVKLGVVDVDVHDCAMLAELLDLAGHPVVEAHTDREQKVRFIGGIVGIDRSVHSQPLERERMSFRESPHAHNGCSHRDLCSLGEFGKLLGSVSGDNATAAIDERPFGILDQPNHFVNRQILGLLQRLIAAKFQRARIDRLSALVLDVLRHVDEHRPWTAGLGDVERLLDDARNVVDVPHEVAVLDHRQRHAEDVGLLEGTPADHFLVDLSRDGDERNRVHERVGDPGDKIRCARPRSGHANPRPAGGAPVALCGECSSLFVPGQHHTDFFRLGQGLMNRH